MFYPMCYRYLPSVESTLYGAGSGFGSIGTVLYNVYRSVPTGIPCRLDRLGLVLRGAGDNEKSVKTLSVSAC